METIVARHDQAVISAETHVFREGGAFYEPGRHWLTATSDRQLHRAVSIVRSAGDTEFAYVRFVGVRAPAENIDGFVRDGTQRVAFLGPGLPLEVITYRQS